jgi:predicted enzyme related to lactoylglutathione lyase
LILQRRPGSIRRQHEKGAASMRRSLRRGRALLAAIGLLAGATAVPAETARYWPPITDPPTEVRAPGRFVWVELLTLDVGTAAEFYGKVFGWTFETYGPKDDLKTYTLVLSGGTPIGGMVYVRPREPRKYPLSRWVGFISVTDVPAAAALTEKDGGKVIVSARKVGERGTEALLMDPEGGIFGVINSATGDPEDYLAGDGQWLWAELWAGDAEKMAAFYKGIGPYEVRGGAASGETTGFQLWSGGYARAGILPRPAKVPTTWLPYVRVQSVTDTVARASEAGGKVVMPPAQVHGTSVAVILDPTGAPFAVAEWPAVAREAAR